MITETSHLSRLRPLKTEDTALSGLLASDGTQRVSTEYDFSGKMRGIVGDAKLDASRLNAKELMDRVISGFAVPNITGRFKAPSFGPPIKGDDDNDDIITQLIKIIMGVITLPKRFYNMFQSLTNATEALAKGIDGLGKSVQLITKDIFTLIIAVLGIIFKYWMCLLSFAITTAGGCFLIHGITFACSVLYLIFPVTAYFIKSATTYDIMPLVDAMFAALSAADEQQASFSGVYLTRWPEAINRICYTCFGKPVKLRDVTADLGAIGDIGIMIANNMNVRIPWYMRDGIPPGRRALMHMDMALK